jgi:hypothetical protein
VQDVVRNALAESIVPAWMPAIARDWLSKRYEARREVCQRILAEIALED